MTLVHSVGKNRRQKRKSRSSECNFVALWFNLPTCDSDSSGFVNGQLFPFSGRSCGSHFARQTNTNQHKPTSLTLNTQHIWTLNRPGAWRRLPVETCYKRPYLHVPFSVAVIRFVKLSLYESCIRSSVPIRYWLFISRTEWKRSFVSNPCFFDSISFGFHYAKVTLGLWSVTRDFWQNRSSV